MIVLFFTFIFGYGNSLIIDIGQDVTAIQIHTVCQKLPLI